jgi:hypothetical protein
MTVESELLQYVGTTQCSATARSGFQCTKSAIPGGAVCHMHGGNAPQVRAAAVSRLTEVRDLALDRMLEQLAPPDSPIYAQELKDLLAVVDKLTSKVQLLSGEATSRDESIEVGEVRLRLDQRLSSLANRVNANETIIDVNVEEEE